MVRAFAVFLETVKTDKRLTGFGLILAEIMGIMRFFEVISK